MTLGSFSSFDSIDNLLHLQRELDQFFRNPARGFGLSPGGNVYPPVNVFTNDSGLVVRAEVPGVKPEDVNVSVEPQRLVISGERKRHEQANGGFHRRERRFGMFSRTISLPENVDPDKASAECRNGVLTVRIPKREEAKPRQIKVQVS